MFIDLSTLPLKVMFVLPILLLVLFFTDLVDGNLGFSEIKRKDVIVYSLKMIFCFLFLNSFFFLFSQKRDYTVTLILGIGLIILFIITLFSTKNFSKKTMIFSSIINSFLFIQSNLFVVYFFNIYLIYITYEQNLLINSFLRWNYLITVDQATQLLEAEKKINDKIKVQNTDVNFKASVYSSGVSLLIHGLFHLTLPGLGFIIKPFLSDSFGAKPYLNDPKLSEELRGDLYNLKNAKSDLDENYKKFRLVTIWAVIIQAIILLIINITGLDEI